MKRWGDRRDRGGRERREKRGGRRERGEEEGEEREKEGLSVYQMYFLHSNEVRALEHIVTISSLLRSVPTVYNGTCITVVLIPTSSPSPSPFQVPGLQHTSRPCPPHSHSSPALPSFPGGTPLL